MLGKGTPPSMSYSAGLLKVGTLQLDGASAKINATTINVPNGTVSANNIVADNFSFNNNVIGGTLTVSSATTLSSVSASGLSDLSNVTVSGTLDVSGNTRLRNVNVSGSLVATGSNVVNTLDVSGAFVTRGTATLANPSFTGVPTAPTATDGTNTTQVATTAFVNTAIGTFNNVVNYLTDKIYCLYLIDVTNGMQFGPSTAVITIKFNKEQTFTLLSHSTRLAGNQFGTIGTVYPYTILSTPTTSVGARIQFFTNGSTSTYFRLTTGIRQSTMTFSVDYKKIVGFKEDLLNFTTLTTANTIVNAITTPVSQSDFLTKFLVAYTANNGNNLYFVDTSGDYTRDASGTRVNMGTTYAADTVNWKRNVACALMSTNSYVAMSENVGNRLQFAQLLYDGNTLVPYIQDGFGACGVLMAPEFFAPTIDKNDIYTIPITIHNSTKRLNGISSGVFEPTQTVFLGKNCTEYEKVAASGSIPAYLKHIAIRGMDVILYNHRLHLDPSQMYYVKGRTLMYARHKQSFLNDTFWYPDGPEFRISLNPLMTVTKLICNDTEIPLHLVKTKNWDPYVKEGNSITFNIAAAIAQTGVTFKYDADTSGGYYTEAGLNKIEIWYEGQYTTRIVSNLVGSVAHIFAPSTKNVPISTLMKNPKIYDEALGYVSKYNFNNGPYGYLMIEPYTGYFVQQRNNGEFPNIGGGIWADSAIEYSPHDPDPFHLYLFAPWNDLQEDAYYHQIEFMVPKPFVPSTGGTRLTPIESVDGNSVLYKFVPGVKAVGDDYRVPYVVDFSWRIRPYAAKVESITLTDGSSIPYYVEVRPEMKAIYDSSGFFLNPTNMQRIIRSCEKIFGKYPYDTIGVGLSTAETTVAMEHFEMISLGLAQMQFNVILHEMVHQWWQNSAGFKSLKDAWIDEGFNTFTNFLIGDDIANDNNNRLYKSMAALKQVDIESGWYAKSVREAYGMNSTLWSYTQIAFMHGTMYYNMGADFKVDGDGKYMVKPVDASGNIAMDLFSSSGVFESVALLSPINVEPLFLRPVIIDTSGTQVFMNSDYKLVNASGIAVSGKRLFFTDGRLDLSGNLTDPSGAPIVAVGQTLTSGLKLPTAPQTSLYQPGTVNTNFVNMFKYVLNAFKNNQYDYMSWRSAISDYINANKTDWSSKWPSTGAEGVELYDEMLNTGGFRELSATNYRITFDAALLPVGTNVVLSRANTTPILTVDGSGYTNTFSTTGFKKLVNITHPIVHLEDASGNALAGSSANFAGKDFTNKIVLIKRNATENLQSQMFLANICGAKGIISYSDTSGAAYTPSLTTGMIQLPCLGVTAVIGASILAQIRAAAPGTVNATISGRLGFRDKVFPRPVQPIT